MSSQITTAFVQQYSNNVQMLSQQKGSLLRNAVDVKLSLVKTLSLNKLVKQLLKKELVKTLRYSTNRYTTRKETSVYGRL